MTKLSACTALGWQPSAGGSQDQEQRYKLLIWKAFVLSCLDYCFQMWSPLCVKLITELEIIQHNYTKETHSVKPNPPDLVYESTIAIV